MEAAMVLVWWWLPRWSVRFSDDGWSAHRSPQRERGRRREAGGRRLLLVGATVMRRGGRLVVDGVGLFSGQPWPEPREKNGKNRGMTGDGLCGVGSSPEGRKGAGEASGEGCCLFGQCFDSGVYGSMAFSGQWGWKEKR
ncbi:hypothetical protein HAX54_052854 [Datura stramonium]|uniref:Uncharacterized protein n=1 Tax=Datura stramonium TaxID=4076 RepID=A0ABS8T0K8_DATST|nr:hypothetical protein [Datura stramonium]